MNYFFIFIWIYKMFVYLWCIETNKEMKNLNTSTCKILINNSLIHTTDNEEVLTQFKALVDYGVGFSIGFIEERWDYDFAYNSKESKLAQKIKEYSHKYHALDGEFNYVTPENELA